MNLENKGSTFIIAIDGPAGSGKTTTARAVARALGFIYVDTGAMYRAVALDALKHGLAMDKVEEICRRVERIRLDIRVEDGVQKTVLDGVDVEEEIRKPEMSGLASEISGIPCVREAMVRSQRAIGVRSGGAVLEGRDIGTVVFPDADLKIFMTADVNRRAERRRNQLLEKGTTVDIDVLRKEIIERDERDSGRALSPLKKAEDAIELDTTDLTIEEQVEFIVKLARKRMNEKREQKV